MLTRDYFFVLIWTIFQGIQLCGSTRVCKTKHCISIAKRIKDNMDPNIEPCDNFYKFACGSFLKHAVIPNDKSTINYFDILSNKVNHQLKDIMSDLKRKYGSKPKRLVKMFYDLCMDEDAIDRHGTDHLIELIDEAGGWPVLGDWEDSGWDFLDTEIFLIDLGLETNSIFSVAVGQDLKNSSRRTIYVDEPNLETLEFLNTGFDDDQVQTYYNTAVDIAVMFGANRENAKRELKKSVEFEIELFKIKQPPENRTDYIRMYNEFDLEDLKIYISWIDWQKLLSKMLPTIVLEDNQHIVLKEKKFFPKLRKLIDRYSKRDIANYMMWKVVFNLKEDLPRKIRNRFQELDKALHGATQESPRWKKCLTKASGISVVMSSLYVTKYFDKKTRHEAIEMVNSIRLELERNIKLMQWMDNATRAEAVSKVNAMVAMVGYPDELRDENKIKDLFKNLTINKDHYLEALLDLKKWTHRFQVSRLHESVNRTDWRDLGQVLDTNAFMIYTRNSIKIPAVILQYPFFNADVPKYVNYATLGTIVGHEMAHGFDVKGSQFDVSGNVREWWSTESLGGYIKRKQCIIDQYNNFKDEETGFNVNGDLTQAENVADNGGLVLAYQAYRLENERSKEDLSLPGLEQYSDSQLFFLSVASLYCYKYRPEALLEVMLYGAHPLAEFRVNGMLKNFPTFSNSFGCEAQQEMNPFKKCFIWNPLT